MADWGNSLRVSGALWPSCRKLIEQLAVKFLAAFFARIVFTDRAPDVDHDPPGFLTRTALALALAPGRERKLEGIHRVVLPPEQTTRAHLWGGILLAHVCATDARSVLVVHAIPGVVVLGQ